MSKKRKCFCLAGMLLFIIVFLTFSSVTAEQIRVTGIRLDKSVLTLPLGEAALVSATVYPTNAANRNLYWVSSNSEILEVMDLGASAQVRALAPGPATVTAITLDGSFRAACMVEIIVWVRALSMEQTNLNLRVNDKTQLIVTFEPRDATDQRLLWESTDPTVASVSEDGVVTALKNGETRIVARSLQDQSITAYSMLTVSGALSSQPVDPGDKETKPVISPPATKPGSINIFLWAGIAAVGVTVLLLAALLFVKGRKRQQAQAPAVPPVQAHPASDSSVSPVTAAKPVPEVTRAKPQQYRPLLKGVAGHFAGQTLELAEGQLVIGRDPRLAQLVYPADNEEISRKHCTVRFDERTRQFLLEDSSSNGTFLSSGEKLDPGKPYSLSAGDRFYLAQAGELYLVALE